MYRKNKQKKNTKIPSRKMSRKEPEFERQINRKLVFFLFA